MLRKTLLLIVIIIGFGACKDQTNTYELSGHIQGLSENELVYLYDNGTKADIDSIVTKEGAFVFKGSVETPSYFYIVIRRENGDVRYKGLWIENSTITFEANIERINEAAISGSLMQEEENKYSKQVSSISEELEAIYEQYDPSNIELVAILEHMIDSLTVLENQEKVKFIKANPESSYSAYLAKRVVRSLSPEEGQDVYAALSEEQKQSVYGTSVKEFLSLNKNLAIGDNYIDLSLPNIHGETISISSLEGKYILIDFWASWCGPCRKESPYLQKAYSQYNSKGFEIYGVSIDKDKDAWIEAVAKDNMTWTSVLADGAFDSKSAMMYGVKYIPFNYLIGPDGKIIEMHLRGDALLEKLKELIGD